jgi:hypothetical protein
MSFCWQHYYRYQRGHRFDKHVDVSRREDGCDTEYTFLLYLNGKNKGLPSLVGGETVFWRSAKKTLLDFEPTAGTALLHAHGKRCLLHEVFVFRFLWRRSAHLSHKVVLFQGAVVQKGSKYLFRADVLFGDPPVAGSP